MTRKQWVNIIEFKKNIFGGIAMNKKIIELIEKIAKLQEELYRPKGGYNRTFMVVLEAVSEAEEPTVTEISKATAMTKGAISKVIKKLIAAELLEKSEFAINRQKIFFQLTPHGSELLEGFVAARKEKIKESEEFFKNYKFVDLAFVSSFLQEYSGYLEEKN